MNNDTSTAHRNDLKYSSSQLSCEDEIFYHNKDHLVLFELPMVHESLRPHVSTEKWDGEHVRMPFSKESKFVELYDGNKKNMRLRWELIIKSLKTDFATSHDLKNAIISYNTRYEEFWSFKALHILIESQMDIPQKNKFLKITLPKIIDLALKMPDLIKCPIQLLKKGMNKSISMTQEQAASILANAFLCTFPRRNTTKRDSEYGNYPDINFHKLFNGEDQKVIEKLKCIINYFERVTKEMPKGVLTFTRRSIQRSQFPKWKEETKTFKNLRYSISSENRIEDASGMLQVDFSNKSIGGGVLGNGAVQEEIRFCMNPELIVARLFTECLEDEESFLMIGTEQFNSYFGYATNFKFAGNFVDKTKSDDFRRKKCQIVAIDAFRYDNYREQFTEGNLIRELNKAYSGFYNQYNSNQAIASGFWGCGAFNGHPIKSALIQLMACRMTRRYLVFFTFNDNDMKLYIENLFEFLVKNSISVSQLLRLMLNFYPTAQSKDPLDLLQFIQYNALDVEMTSRAPETSSSTQLQPLKKLKFPSASNNSKLEQFGFKSQSFDAKKFQSPMAKPQLPTIKPQSSTFKTQSIDSRVTQQKTKLVEHFYDLTQDESESKAKGQINYPRYSETQHKSDKDRFDSVKKSFMLAGGSSVAQCEIVNERSIQENKKVEKKSNTSSLLFALDDFYNNE
ncbi:poly(ADP-ribose) glycohydrolase-like [Chironomus tepperi]|uniref:poly(ADP-ribose) glycohydrolase-like n=1 Tax=Chironomus tepperi TaxID=113505 RepID=UPI00391F3D96